MSAEATLVACAIFIMTFTSLPMLPTLGLQDRRYFDDDRHLCQAARVKYLHGAVCFLTCPELDQFRKARNCFDKPWRDLIEMVRKSLF